MSIYLTLSCCNSRPNTSIKSNIGYISVGLFLGRVEAFQSILQLMAEKDMFEYYEDTQKVAGVDWTRQKARAVLEAFQRKFSQVSATTAHYLGGCSAWVFARFYCCHQHYIASSPLCHQHCIYSPISHQHYISSYICHQNKSPLLYDTTHKT